ncbi:MAG: LPS export ABC transporter periplasmic protein LptC [Candidatus Cloacimonetes bacterium 4572_55]|nr:MAG: LPS export ABC transporter periplasmic protein LptC [Candidatus Cloacimonetes bacterium 4572_55]
MTRLLSAIILVFCFIACNRCDWTTPQPDREPNADLLWDADPLPDQEIEKFTVIETKLGKRKYKAVAEHAKIFKDRGETVASQLEVVFYDQEGIPFSTLTSDSGLISEKTKNMRAAGNVVVVNRDSARLESEELKWDHGKEKIISDKFVKITRGRDTLTGIGLETDPQLKEIEIKKDVNAYLIDVDETQF